MPDNLAFCDPGIDRADHARADPARLADFRQSEDALLLELDGLAPRLADTGGLRFTRGALPQELEAVFLGLDDGTPLFAAVPAAGDTRPAYEQRASWAALGQLGGRDLAIYGAARSLVDWHARHRYCANCGRPTRLAKGGWQRDCAREEEGGCGAPHFPRTDPVAIMLVEHEGALLLGRNTRFPPRSYSALAGFIEPGETIEAGVAREVYEEAGVAVRDVTYLASQPWPFPSQLMIGCHGFANGRDLVIDHTEIEDARWFTREEVAEALANWQDARSFVPPPRYAIAHYLLEHWLETRQ